MSFVTPVTMSLRSAKMGAAQTGAATDIQHRHVAQYANSVHIVKEIVVAFCALGSEARGAQQHAATSATYVQFQVQFYTEGCCSPLTSTCLL